MASMEKDYFWGCELSKDKKEYSWDSEDEELSKADIEQKLVVSQACLGPKAKVNEKNLVQVTTTDGSDSTVTFTILSLTSGKTDQCRLSLAFPSSATFNLIEGSGPVHLTGTVYQELYLLDDEEESDEDEDEMVKSEAKVSAKKRPLVSETPKGPPKKLARVEVDKEESEEEEEDDDDDDDEGGSTEESTKMEVDTKQKQNKTEQTPKTAKKKQEGKDVKVKKKDTEEDSEEDEESDDESDEDDDEEEESDEDESEEDESDEDDDEEEDESDEEDEITTSLTAKKQEAKGAKKKPITNGVVKQDKKNKQEKSKTPAPQLSTPKTGANKDEVKKSGSKTPQPLDMDKIKERLLKTPNLPRKVDKFKNYLKHSFKVTDDAELTKLWDWVKANK